MKMRRGDRLFEIIQQIRRGRLTTARKLAERLEVSERTIYRDICDLIACGVPNEGEAGVGYSLRKGYDPPPLMFTEDELEALIFGARIVSQQMVCKWRDGLSSGSTACSMNHDPGAPRRATLNKAGPSWRCPVGLRQSSRSAPLLSARISDQRVDPGRLAPASHVSCHAQPLPNLECAADTTVFPCGTGRNGPSFKWRPAAGFPPRQPGRAIRAGQGPGPLRL